MPQLDAKFIVNLPGGGGAQTPSLNNLTTNLTLSANYSLILGECLNAGTSKVFLNNGAVIKVI